MGKFVAGHQPHVKKKMTEMTIPEIEPATSRFNWFDINEYLSYNAHLLFLIGERGVGKTWSVQKKLIDKFRANGDRFIFLKRSLVDIQAIAPDFFTKIVHEHYNDEIDIIFQGGKFYFGEPSKPDIDPEQIEMDELATPSEKRVKSGVKSSTQRFVDVQRDYPNAMTVKTVTRGRAGFEYREMGYSVSLRNPEKLKGVGYIDVRYLIFDEYVDYNGSYLYDEAARIADVIETTVRMRDDFVVFLLGNSNMRTYLPIFDQLGLRKVDAFEPAKVYRYKGGNVLICYLKNEAYQEVKSKTALGRIMEGTDYFETMIKNIAKSNTFEVWLDDPKIYQPGVIFVVHDGDKVYGYRGMKTGGGAIIAEITGRVPDLTQRYAIDGRADFNPLPIGEAIKSLIVSRKLKFDKIQTAQRFFDYTAKTKM